MTRISMPAGAGVLRRIIPVAMFCACVLTGCSRREAVLPVIPYPAAAEVYDDVFEMQNMSWWIDPAADRLSRAAILRFFDAAAGGAMQKNSPAARQDEADIRFIVDKKLPGEHYRLEVGRNGIRVDASDFRGFIYACQTLRQLCPAVPFCRVEDGPRFRYRGMHLDVSRHFFPVATVKRFIDLLELHKLNVLHWHLTDDQGWRVEIRRYPQLTQTGAWRKRTSEPVGASDTGDRYGGYYTQDEIREVVTYAADRGITVIPEIDMPGHMQAALTAYPELGCTGGPYEVWTRWGISDDVLCPGRESVFRFVEGVLDEIMELFPSEFIHIGGDECPKTRWQSCPRCQQWLAELGVPHDSLASSAGMLQSYFTERVEAYLKAKGRRAIGWDEILDDNSDSEAAVMSWRGIDGGRTAAVRGRDAVMTPNQYLYFDYRQSLEPDEPGASRLLTIDQVYRYEPVPEGLDEEQRRHIIGVQANLWTEYVEDESTLQYMLLPRLDALSELQWCRPEAKDYDRFLKNIEQMFAIYDAAGYNYSTRSREVHARVYKTGKHFEIDLTTSGGAPVYYTTDGSEPVVQSADGPAVSETAVRYDGTPVAITHACTFRASVVRNDGIHTRQIVFHENKAFGREVSFGEPPHPTYTFDAATGLTDGIAGDPGCPTSGEWFGWQKPMDVTVDMGEAPETYRSVRLSFFVNKPGHYFPPVRLEVQTSADGETFVTAAERDLPTEGKEIPEGIRTFTLDFPETDARYVRVRAVSPRLPEWHPAHGFYAFILTDEITIL